MILHPLIEKFLTRLRVEKGLSPRTLETYLYPLKALNQFSVDKNLNLRSITEDDILAFLTQRKDARLSSATMFMTVLCVRLFYRYLTSHKMIAQDPTDQLSLPAMEESIPNPLVSSEMDKLLVEPSIDKYSLWRTHVLVHLAYNTGLRASEVTSLRLDQVNLDGGFIRVRGKRRKERIIPLGPRIIEKLTRYLTIRAKKFPAGNRLLFLSDRGKPIDRKTFWWLLKRLAKRVGIQGPVSPHRLRHSFATDLTTNGISMRALQILLSHKNLKTTERYSHVNLEFLRESMKNHPRYA